MARYKVKYTDNIEASSPEEAIQIALDAVVRDPDLFSRYSVAAIAVEADYE
jgi:hypothetical protein